MRALLLCLHPSTPFPAFRLSRQLVFNRAMFSWNLTCGSRALIVIKMKRPRRQCRPPIIRHDVLSFPPAQIAVLRSQPALSRLLTWAGHISIMQGVGNRHRTVTMIMQDLTCQLGFDRLSYHDVSKMVRADRVHGQPCIMVFNREMVRSGRAEQASSA